MDTYDLRQPLLKVRNIDTSRSEYLIPEHCLIVGVTSDMMYNFFLNRDLSNATERDSAFELVMFKTKFIDKVKDDVSHVLSKF